MVARKRLKRMRTTRRLCVVGGRQVAWPGRQEGRELTWLWSLTVAVTVLGAGGRQGLDGGRPLTPPPRLLLGTVRPRHTGQVVPPSEQSSYVRAPPASQRPVRRETPRVHEAAPTPRYRPAGDDTRRAWQTP